METRWILVFLGLISLSMSTEKVRYDNYRVFRVLPTTQDHVKLLRNLETTFGGVSFWKDPGHPNRTADIMVVPHKIGEFQTLMNSRGIKSETYVENVQTLIDNERPAIKPTATMGWEDYYPLADINAWLDSLVAANPDIVSPIVVGSSYEGRQLVGVKVSYKAGNPAVFLEGGMHAREWIGPASATFLLNQLLTSTDSNLRTIAENLDWYIVPNANPDGYVYSWTNDRQWRKTRSNGFICKGVDPNRNWDYRWMEEDSSSNQCSDLYAGSKAFSEIETRSMSEYITNLAGSSNLVAYLSFHSYSQLLMYPFGSAYDTASNVDELDTVARKAANALAQRYGTRYSVGPVYDVISIPVESDERTEEKSDRTEAKSEDWATGTSCDWVKQKLGTRFSFDWELRDTGRYGFVLPANQIIPTAQETMDSVVSIALDILASL